jgi:opacity protein-like surface antigen
MKRLAAVLLAPALLAIAAPAVHAQRQALALEARGGITLPVRDFGERAHSGFAMDGTVGYHIFPALGVYAGFSRDAFGCPDDIEPGGGCDAHGAGFELGARATMLHVPLKPWARGGVIYHHLIRRMSPQGFPIEARSALTLGYEIGGGIAVPLTPSVALTPAIRYRAYGADFGNSFGTGPLQRDVRYFVADVGLRYVIGL